MNWTSFKTNNHITLADQSPYGIFFSVRKNRFVMAEKREHSHPGELHNCFAKFVYLVSFVSLLICVTALVRVEIINQRVHVVEDFVAEVKQTLNVELSSDVTSFKHAERVKSADDFHHRDAKVPRKDATEVHIQRFRARRFTRTKPEDHKLTIEAVRNEINRTLHYLTPQAFCSPKEQICVQGPPGIQGPKGSRGRRGPRGVTGRKGARGDTGYPGPHGKQGVTGPPGQKGEQGTKGEPGPRGFTGAKGEAGESISMPTVVISPLNQTVRENQNAVFQCSATGNPQPTVTWLRSGVSGWTHRFQYEPDGRLVGHHVTLVDAGKYTCVGRNVLGSSNNSAILIVEAPPRVQLAPGPKQAKTGQNIMLPKCYVTGFPAPAVTWRKLTGVLPRNRVLHKTGSLTLIAAERNDSGPYECTASNHLGKVSAITSVFVWSPPKFITKPPRSTVKFVAENLSLVCSATAQASISWRRIGGAWEEGRMKVQNGTLRISALKKSDSGDYICEAKLPFYNIESRTTLDVDLDECNANAHTCDVNAACQNTVRSYTCSCKAGYTGDGQTCNDLDECSTNSDTCDVNAGCQNTVGSYTCSCKAGYTGDGQTCNDLDECSTNSDTCDVNAACQNTVGSYTCSCKAGYTGDGQTCNDINECSTNAHICDVNALCTNTPASYTCACKVGYSGDGRTCTGHDFNATFTCDDSVEMFADAISLGKNNAWGTATTFLIPGNTRVIAVAGKNAGGPCGVLGSTSNGLVTNESWKCSSILYPGWTSPDFDDHNWLFAAVVGNHGDPPWYTISGIAMEAKWIWAADQIKKDVYCRLNLQ